MGNFSGVREERRIRSREIKAEMEEYRIPSNYRCDCPPSPYDTQAPPRHPFRRKDLSDRT